ncbi:MAG: basic amino acid ABC transporter substrate-binding protein [Lachnospiraceae bacterium]
MKKIAIVLILAMSASLLAACGATASEDLLSDGVLSVGTNAEFPPFEYIGDDGEPDGFDIALVKAIGEELGVEVTIENMEFASLVASVGTKVDIAAAGMTVTEEREQEVTFSEPYYDAVQYVIVPADSDIASAEDLIGKKIGVQLGTTGDFIAAEVEGAEVATYNKAVDAVSDMLNDRVDCVIIDKNPALVFAEKYPDEVVSLDGADFGFEVEQYAIALPKGNEELAEKINGAISTLKENGTFDELVSEYIEENE